MTNEVRITQAVVETASASVPVARITQAVVEAANPSLRLARITQFVVEVLSPSYSRRRAHVVPVNTRRFLPPHPRA